MYIFIKKRKKDTSYISALLYFYIGSKESNKRVSNGVEGFKVAKRFKNVQDTCTLVDARISDA